MAMMVVGRQECWPKAGGEKGDATRRARARSRVLSTRQKRVAYSTRRAFVTAAYKV